MRRRSACLPQWWLLPVTLSPMGAGLRPAIRRQPTNTNSKKLSEADDKEISSPEPGETGMVPGQTIPDRFSVAVLPFENMSDDKEQEYLADGLTEDIITGLRCAASCG